MNIFKELKRKYKLRRERFRNKYVSECAQRIYQITEYNGEIWLTFNNQKVLPLSFLKNDDVTVLIQLRELYFKNHR